MNVPIFGIRKKMGIFDGKEYLTKEETERDFLKKQDAKEQYVSKNTFEKKNQEIEATLETKIGKQDLPDHSIYLEKKDLDPYALKEDIPEIPDHAIYALKEEIPTNYLTKEDLPKPFDDSNLVKKEEVEKFITKDDLPDLSPYLKKSELPPEQDLSIYAKQSDLKEYAVKESVNSKAEISEMQKRLCIDDFEKHKAEAEIKYAKKSDLEGLIDKDCVDLSSYLKKEDLPPPQDLSGYAKKNDFYNKKETEQWFLQKSEIDKYIKPIEICYCMVKLKNDFKIYDGNDWAFEFFMGNRGNWHVIHDSHQMIQKPEEYQIITPFKGIFSIDFCFTCRKDTHILKPRVLQRIRSSGGEFINWKYHNISPETVTKPNVSVLTFRNRVELMLEKGNWIKCSMEFDNRLHNHKKDWLHAVGSDGAYTPTYFSITGHKIQ